MFTKRTICRFARGKSPISSLLTENFTRGLSFQSSCTFSILFEDVHIIAINKSADVLSVPGKGFAEDRSLSRREQWFVAIARAASTASLDDNLSSVLQKLLIYDSVPRKEDLFIPYLSKYLQIKDKLLCERAWKEIVKADFSSHNSQIIAKPAAHVSAMEVLEHQRQKRLYPIHRLDLETSGVLLFAKTSLASSELSRQFRDKEISKSYIARVAYRVHAHSQRIEIPIRPDLNNRPYQVVDVLNGKSSSTDVTVINYSTVEVDRMDTENSHNLGDERYQKRKSLKSTTTVGIDSLIMSDGTIASTIDVNRLEIPISCLTPRKSKSSFETTLVKLKPITGRTHQLRVHMAHSGHPILGDSLYAPPLVRMASKRLCLHAQSITFKHPATGEVVTLTSQNCDFLEPIG